MPVNNPLLVPIKVKAFVFNKALLDNPAINIQRWQYAYPFLNLFTTPQPNAFSGTKLLPDPGVILHWTLPDIMRSGVQNAHGEIDFPLVPNRWLVVRYNGPADARMAVAWVVQSDALGNNDPVTGGSPYLNPFADSIVPTYTGQVVTLDNWQEPNPPLLFLKAVAPGNNMFASYQPYCSNVFSICDPLSGVADKDTLSYFVGGWYSKASDDITGSWQPNSRFSDFLSKAFWRLAAPGDDTATNGIYHSMICEINWDANGPAITNIPDGKKVKVAVGNTTTDALTALIKAQAPAGIDPDLLEALQYDLLQEYDKSDWSYELKQHIETSWFGAHDGGDLWEIVDKPVDPNQGDPPAPISAAERAIERAWLEQLNQQQATVDTAGGELTDMQWNLYQIWWKYGNARANGLTSPYPEGTSEEQFKAALNSGNPESLVSKVNEQMIRIQTLRSGLATFIRDHPLPVTRELKQYARRPFHWSYDPVVLMQGLKNETMLTPRVPLVCRFLDQAVNAFMFNGSPITVDQVAPVIPVLPNMQSAPVQFHRLIQEFFLLDPANATLVAKAALHTSDPDVIEEVKKAMKDGQHVTGTSIRPDLALGPWQQPWSPLVMVWDIAWYPIPHEKLGAPLWSFDGNDYTWNGKGFDAESTVREFQRMIFLTPQAGYNFRSQIAKFIHDNKGDSTLIEAMKALEAFIDKTDHWDFLSQSLAGLTALLNLRDPDPNVSASVDQHNYFPDKKLATLTGSSATYVPLPGAAEARDPSGFQNWRAGQFNIRRLRVVDAFGQSCDVVTSFTEQSFKPVIAPSLQPQVPVISQDGYRFIQLAPRILQPGRLNLDFIPNQAGGISDIATHTNPVIAFLLHNYLDESIACYDGNGNILGSVWVITNDDGEEDINWFPAPDSPFLTIDELVANPVLSDLGLMWNDMKHIGPAAFNSMIETLDKSSLTIDSTMTTADTGMLLLAGQPVAMTRLRVQFELEGNVMTDPSWRFTFDMKKNPVIDYKFNVRFGESGQRSDGLVGYFANQDFRVFYTPNLPARLPDPGYVKTVGKGESVQLSFDANSNSYLTVLMDPRALVHATTGILPVTNISIPSEYINRAFARIDLTFQVGPLLTDAIRPTGANEKPFVVLPHPVLKNGEWSWQQLEADKWETYDLKPAVPTAQFSNISPVIRQGLLRLTGAVKL